MDFWIRCIPRKIEEKVVYQEIIDSFLIELGGFLLGYYSTDKSFLWKNLYADWGFFSPKYIFSFFSF